MEGAHRQECGRLSAIRGPLAIAQSSITCAASPFDNRPLSFAAAVWAVRNATMSDAGGEHALQGLSQRLCPGRTSNLSHSSACALRRRAGVLYFNDLHKSGGISSATSKHSEAPVSSYSDIHSRRLRKAQPAPANDAAGAWEVSMQLAHAQLTPWSGIRCSVSLTAC